MNPQNTPTPSMPAGDLGTGGGGTQSGGAIADTKQKIAQTARETASKVKAAASDTVAKARGEAERIASDKKESAAERIGSYSSAIHESARSIEQKDPNIAWFTHRAADKLQGVADYMRNSDFGCLRGDCEGIARRHPAAFFGGMFFAGLLLGNMVKASRRGTSSELGYGGQSEMDWSDGRSDGLETQPDLTAAERGAAGI
jgi:hypothetical protein